MERQDGKIGWEGKSIDKGRGITEAKDRGKRREEEEIEFGRNREDEGGEEKTVQHNVSE